MTFTNDIDSDVATLTATAFTPADLEGMAVKHTAEISMSMSILFTIWVVLKSSAKTKIQHE
jgi:uncharacterized protein with PQ loop repeat